MASTESTINSCKVRCVATTNGENNNLSIKLKRSCIVMFNDFQEMVEKLSHASGNLEYVSSLYTHSFMFVGCEGHNGLYRQRQICLKTLVICCRQLERSSTPQLLITNPQ
uniref:Uncharacterized protein n=1 Tax=Glossina pallidipes TaxID=7398 RepID=A0A1A9ZC01_GLOPL